jgi:DNA processing protein
MMLAAFVEPGDAKVGELIARHGAIETLCSERLLPLKLQQRKSEVTVESIQLATQNAKAFWITPDSELWPSQLNDLEVLAPLGLWCLGNIELLGTPLPAISMVGSRSSTQYGEHVAVELSAALASNGMTVVSGGALGIDAACHRGALAAQGSTIAILAGGVDVPYPKSNDTMFQRIKQNGLLVSESPPGAQSLRHRFLIRNRLIAAWGWGTVVIEAQIRSGAIATASHAAGLNRDVMAVPGPITATASEGCHQLIRDGAVLVSCAGDIVELIAGDLPRHAFGNSP